MIDGEKLVFRGGEAVCSERNEAAEESRSRESGQRDPGRKFLNHLLESA